MPYEQVAYDVEARVATIRLDRPDRLNAWTATMGEEFRHAVDEAVRDPGVRAIVVTGAGRGFCPGVDVKQLENAAGRHDLNASQKSLSEQEVDRDYSYNYLLRVPKPVIAGINGSLAGIGLCLALCCDLRYMAAGARLATAFARRGLVAEHGSAWLLPRLIGPLNAFDLLLSGRTIDTAEAERLGLVRMLPARDFGDRVQAIAAALANECSPRSMARIKAQIVAGYDQDLAEATRMSAAETLLSHASADFREGVTHYLERRAPDFPGE